MQSNLSQYNTRSPYQTKLLSPARSTYQSNDVGLERDSPAKLRMKLLSEKWQNVQYGLEKEKQEKKESLEYKLKQIEERINREAPADEAKFKLLKEQMIKLQESIDNEKQSRELFDENNSQDIKRLDENLQNLIEEEKANKKFVESNLNKKLDEKFFNINLNMSKNNKIYEENRDTKLQEVNQAIQSIKEQVDLAKKKREESTAILIEQIENEISKFHEMLLIEKKVREETQNKIFKMIEDIHGKLQSDISVESKERESTNESLLKLLEDTCNRIDKNFRS